MSLSLVTGYAGKPHVKSSQDGAFNAAVYGTGKYVFDIGNQFTHEIISNNIVRVKDGYALNQGRFMGMETGDYEDVTIDNGLQGVKRSDLIVMRYTLNPDTGIETSELVVIKGTSGDVYSDPESIEGNILNGASEDDFLLYRVKIDGINIVAVEPLFTVSSSAMMMINAVEKKVDDTKDSVVSFTSADNKKPTEWTDVSVLAGGEKHGSLFNKISTMFKNIRWLYKMLGTTDISAIGGGTVTGAISALNTNLWKRTVKLLGTSYYAPEASDKPQYSTINTDVTEYDLVLFVYLYGSKSENTTIYPSSVFISGAFNSTENSIIFNYGGEASCLIYSVSNGKTLSFFHNTPYFPVQVYGIKL